MLQVRTCVIVHCDQCGAACWDGRDYEPHWPTEEAALAEVAAEGWYVEDPRLLCPDCGAVLTCEAVGHEFTDWQPCRCEQRVAAHPPGPDGRCGVEFRHCERCCLHESRLGPDGRAAA